MGVFESEGREGNDFLMPFVWVCGGGVDWREPLGETIEGLRSGGEGGVGPECLGKRYVDLDLLLDWGIKKGIRRCEPFRDSQNRENRRQKQSVLGVGAGMPVCYFLTSRVVWSLLPHRSEVPSRHL